MPQHKAGRGEYRIADVATKSPPAETVELRRGLQRFLSQRRSNFIADAPTTAKGASITVGAVKWGVYAFFDYDGEPIYVGRHAKAWEAGLAAI